MSITWSCEGICSTSILFRDTFFHMKYKSSSICVDEEITKKQMKTHGFNVVRQIAYVYRNKEEDFHYI